MSYHILYEKQFVKIAEDKYIPMMLGGDNNVWEAGKGNKDKRCRNWYNYPWYTDGNPYASKAEIMKKVDDILVSAKKSAAESGNSGSKDEVNAEDNFGWFEAIALGSRHTSNTTFRKYKNFILSGIKNSLTLEQLKEAGVKLQLGGGYGSDIPAVDINSIDDIDAYNNSLPEEKTLYFHFVTCTGWRNYERVLDNIKAYRRKINPPKPKKEKVAVKLDKFYTLSNSNGYLVKYVRNGFRYNGYSPCQAKIFETEKIAQKYADKLIKDHKYKADEWKVTLVNEVITIYK